MNSEKKSFSDFISGLDWGEETLAEQRERIAKKILTPDQYEKRCSVMKPIIEPIEKFTQLKLF